jgi:hypothetical protein
MRRFAGGTVSTERGILEIWQRIKLPWLAWPN